LNTLIKNTITGFSILIIFLLGYLRELVFLTINAVVDKVPFPYTRAYLKPPNFLYDLSPSFLFYLKWGLTFIFSLLFCLFTLLLVNFYFKSKSFNKLTIITYAVLFICSLFISLLGFLFDQFNSFYTISRVIAGLLQYPLLSLIIFTMFYFIKKLHNE